MTRMLGAPSSVPRNTTTYDLAVGDGANRPTNAPTDSPAPSAAAMYHHVIHVASRIRCGQPCGLLVTNLWMIPPPHGPHTPLPPPPPDFFDEEWASSFRLVSQDSGHYATTQEAPSSSIGTAVPALQLAAPEIISIRPDPVTVMRPDSPILPASNPPQANSVSELPADSLSGSRHSLYIIAPAIKSTSREDANPELPRMATITLRSSGDKERDVRRLRR